MSHRLGESLCVRASFQYVPQESRLKPHIKDDLPRVIRVRFPVIYRVVGEGGKEYFDVKTFTEMLNWLDSLDRI